MITNAFYSCQKLFSFLRYLNFCSDFLVIEKWFNKKANVNCKINNVTDWTTNNYNTYIVQYLKKQRQPDN